MRILLVAAVMSVAVLGAARPGRAGGCAKDDPNGTAVIAARHQIATDCVCDPNNPPTVNHGQYVKCAAAIANARTGGDPNDPNSLPKSCKGPVKKAAARSSCGKAGFVTCCVTIGKGPKCKISRESACMAKNGTPPLDPNNPSCLSLTQPLTADSCSAP